MYNPFTLLSAPLLNELVKTPKLVVREYYARGIGREGSLPLLLSFYNKDDSTERNRAQMHMRQLRGQRLSFLYDSEDPVHLSRLQQAATQPAGYHVYVNMCWKKWEPTPELRRRVYAFLTARYPGWEGSMAKRPSIALQDLYGKLYLHLGWHGGKAEVLLDEVM